MTTFWMIIAALAVLALWPLWLPALIVIFGALVLGLGIAAIAVMTSVKAVAEWVRR